MRCIEFVLGSMQQNADTIDTLRWVKGRFQADDIGLSRLTRALQMDLANVLQSVRNNTEMLDKARAAMQLKQQVRIAFQQEVAQQRGGAGISRDVNNVTEEELTELERIMALFAEEPEEQSEATERVAEPDDLTDEALISLAAKPYGAFLEAGLGVMASDMSYPDKISELQKLEGDIRDEYGNSHTAQRMMLAHPERMLSLSIVIACTTSLAEVYTMYVRHVAHENALAAGIAVCLLNARQGSLPEALPEGVPKDPFTGRDFTYEITEHGFTLSLPDEGIVAGRRCGPFEFRVR